MSKIKNKKQRTEKMSIPVFAYGQTNEAKNFWEENGWTFVKARRAKWYESNIYDCYLEFERN